MDHINSANTLVNIGLLFKSQGQLALAKEQLSRGYRIMKVWLGENHPTTLMAYIDVQNMGGDVEHNTGDVEHNMNQ